MQAQPSIFFINIPFETSSHIYTSENTHIHEIHLLLYTKTFTGKGNKQNEAV